MKRTTFTLFLALLLGFFASASSQGIGNEDVALLKGRLVDVDKDGFYDELDFKVKTKKGILEIPVTSISIVAEDGSILDLVPSEPCKSNGNIDQYSVDLEGLGLNSKYFELVVTLDISELLEDDPGYIVNAGPGTKPNETVLVLKYP